MENNINNKNNNNFMIKILSFFMISFFLMFSVNAIYQDELIRYEFEEGGGSVILDSSGNGFTGLQTGISWRTNNINGIYSAEFDGGNDYIDVLSGSETPTWLFINFWADFDTGANKETLFSIKGLDENYVFYIDYTDNGYIKVDFLNENLVTETITLIDVTANTNWNHYIIGINAETDTFCAFRNTISYCKENVTNGIYRDNSIKTLKIGADHLNTYNDFDGRIDSYRIFSGILNETQISTLYNTNEIILIQEIDDEEPVNGTIVNETLDIIIINEISPVQNTTLSNFDNIEINLNVKATCDLYIDNDLKEIYEDVTAFNYPLTEYMDGSYEYMVYCEYIENNTKYYELSEYITFNIEKPSKTIDFYMYNQNNELLTEFDDLYLATPCFTSQQFNEYYIGDEINYIQKLNNGLASFNLSFDGSYEFCLLKGKLNYKDDTFSDNYDLVSISKQTELGTLFVGNETLTYSLKVDDTDLYQVYEPIFWGKTWASLFQLIIGVLLGGLIIGLGLMAGVDKLVIVGGLIIAIGMGVSVTTFVGAII